MFPYLILEKLRRLTCFELVFLMLMQLGMHMLGFSLVLK